MRYHLTQVGVYVDAPGAKEFWNVLDTQKGIVVQAGTYDECESWVTRLNEEWANG